MSIMNMPPLPYLKRIPGLATDALQARVHRCRRVGQFRARAGDPVQPGPAGHPPAGREDQRAAGHAADQLQGGPLRNPTQPTAMLRQMQADIEAARYDPGDGAIELPVKLKVHDSIFVPLAKWAMLLTGNYRCVTQDARDRHQGRGAPRPRRIALGLQLGVRSLREARRRPRTIWCRSRNTPPRRMDLVRPSSAARALFNGVPNIERTDRLVQLIAAQYGMRNADRRSDRRDRSTRGSRPTARPPPDLPALTGSLPGSRAGALGCCLREPPRGGGVEN